MENSKITIIKGAKEEKQRTLEEVMNSRYKWIDMWGSHSLHFTHSVMGRILFGMVLLIFLFQVPSGYLLSG